MLPDIRSAHLKGLAQTADLLRPLISLSFWGAFG